MSNTSMESPIPAQPVGTTFKVAAGLLVAFLILQIAAVGWFFLPRLQEAIVSRAVAQKPVETPAPTPAAAAATPVPQPTAAPAPKEPDEATYEKITALVAESDKAFRIGEYDLGLQKITEADHLLPNDAGILLRIGRLHEKRGETADAAAIYNRVLALPDLGQELRAQTRRKLGMLEVSKPEPAAPSVIAPEKGADARDEFGLQPGAILGIVDTRLSDAEGRKKVLRISIKSRPGQSIDTTQMRVHVFFYDKDSAGNIELTESKIVTQWISPPVNWSENEPELLDATYTAPSEPGTELVGYVVGVYYAGELQDTRANPGSLATENPLPLYLTSQNP